MKQKKKSRCAATKAQTSSPPATPTSPPNAPDTPGRTAKAEVETEEGKPVVEQDDGGLTDDGLRTVEELISAFKLDPRMTMSSSR